MGLTPSNVSFSAPAKTNGTAKRAAPAAKQNKSKEKSRKRGGIPSNDSRRVACFRDDKYSTEPSSDDADISTDNAGEEESAAETDEEKDPTNPAPSAKRQRTLGGRVTKRVSPRKGKKTDYKKLDDPFVTMDNAEDENGNNIFGEPVGTESEDTYATDGSFKEAKMGAEKEEEEDAAVKMEEAV